jgi:hypothetical protein
MVLEDGMVADAGGNMPDSLVIAADQAFLSDGLGNASVVVHGRRIGMRIREDHCDV